MTIEEELKDLKTQITQAQSKQARAQIEKENAQAALLVARTALKDEFGVSTNEEAKALLVSLTSDLDESVASVKAALLEAEAV